MTTGQDEARVVEAGDAVTPGAAHEAPRHARPGWLVRAATPRARHADRRAARQAGTELRQPGRRSPAWWRTALLLLGVMALQLGFIWSYVGAFHHPSPHRAPVAVVAPAPIAARTAAELTALPSSPLHATVAASETAAQAQLRHDQIAAVLVVNPSAAKDTVLLASAGGASLADAVHQVLARAEAGQHRAITVRDVVPLQAGDARGLTGFYLVIGWIVGGYLVAALLGMTRGTRPASRRQALLRLAALAPYAVVSGLGGALIAGPMLGALNGHLIGLWGLGALLVFTAAAVTVAFEALFGVLGIGLTVLLFVVLGNPSAGGAYPPALLPGFWRALSGALPNGAGTDAVRRIVYFGGHGITGHLLVIAAYAAAGAVIACLPRARTPGRAPAPPPVHRPVPSTAGDKAITCS